MNNFLKTYFLPAIIISATTLLGFFIVMNWSLSILNAGLILTVISSLALIYYKDNLELLKYILFLSIFLSSLVLFFTTEEKGPWMWSLGFAYAGVVLVGMVFGLIFMKLYYWIIGNHVSVSKNKIILAFVYLVTIIFIIFNSITNVVKIFTLR